MTALEDLTAGASVRGLLASGVAKVESVQWIDEQPSRPSSVTAKNAKYGFSPLISFGRAEPVAVAKRGPPVVVVMEVEEFERLKALDASAKAPAAERRANEGRSPKSGHRMAAEEETVPLAVKRTYDCHGIGVYLGIVG